VRNTLWQVFAVTVVSVAMGLLVWDAFLRGHRSHRALLIALFGAVIVVAGGVVQADHGGVWGLLFSAVGVGLVEVARRTERKTSS